MLPIKMAIKIWGHKMISEINLRRSRKFFFLSKLPTVCYLENFSLFIYLFIFLQGLCENSPTTRLGRLWSQNAFWKWSENGHWNVQPCKCDFFQTRCLCSACRRLCFFSRANRKTLCLCITMCVCVPNGTVQKRFAAVLQACLFSFADDLFVADQDIEIAWICRFLR